MRLNCTLYFNSYGQKWNNQGEGGWGLRPQLRSPFNKVMKAGLGSKGDQKQ
jgi:hypothetical protein